MLAFLGVPTHNNYLNIIAALRKYFVILQLYWCCLVVQNTVAEIWSNSW